MCTPMLGECIAATEEDCLKSVRCKQEGACYPYFLTPGCNKDTLMCKGNLLLTCTSPPD